MLDDVRALFPSLRSTAPFFSLRFVEERGETLTVRRGVTQPLQLSLDRGAMLTVVRDGGYGYAATSDLSLAGLQAALDRADAWARATARASVIDFAKVQFPSPRGRYHSPPVDPTAKAARREVLELLRAEDTAAQIDDRIVDRTATVRSLTADHLYLTNQGGEVVQQYRYAFPNLQVTASDGPNAQTRSLAGQYNGFCQQGGLELIARAGMIGGGRRVAEEAIELLLAPNCPTGAMDVLLMPDQMMLQIHESIGHPLELDRILGDERNFAGTSFVTLDMFGTYRYGSELLNVTYDPTRNEQLASFGFDDEGMKAERQYIIRAGMLERPLGGQLSTTRAGVRDGVANARASSWNRAPIDRMANLNLEPGDKSLEAMIAGIERGVMMKTNVSWSIDDSRNKFQFGCEWGRMIENGKLGHVVRNPNYRGISASFWRSLKAVGDTSTFEVMGTPFCGKGEPSQVVRVGHASPACVFGDVSVFGGEA
jgi:predicted Zn-dependent protease